MKKKQEKTPVIVGEPLLKSIISYDGVVLCRKGTIVTYELIERLSNWIEEAVEKKRTKRKKKKPVKKNNRNNIIKRLEFEELVSRKTREELENGATDFFSGIKDRSAKTNMSAIEDSISNLVDELPDNQDVPLKLFELKKHSSYVFRHSVECSVMAAFIASALNYSPDEVNSFALAMMLHDTGVLHLPERLFTQTGKLSNEDWLEIKKHPKLGWDSLKIVPGMDPLALLITLGHHVSADGSGYPADVDYGSLPMLAHISAIIDDFSALTSERSFRPAFHMNEAIEIILQQRDKYHPGAVENFITAVGVFPITTFLRLNTGEIGVVVRNNPENLFLPELKLVLDPVGKSYSNDIIVNLINEPIRKVVDVVDDV